MRVTDEMAAVFGRISEAMNIGSEDSITDWNRRRLQAWVDLYGLELRQADAEPDVDDDAASELHKILESPMLTHQRIVETALMRCSGFAEVYRDDAVSMAASILGVSALLEDLGVLKVKA